MAESLRAERQSNGPDRAQFLDFVERHASVAEELADAQETVRSIRKRRKDLRKLIQAEGHNLPEFDRALADAERSGEEREAALRAYRDYMTWLGKPIGTQGGLDLVAVSSEIELARAEREGFAAGKRGDRADSNSWTPGREEHQRWHSGWLRGQAEKVTAEVLPGDEPPKRRGRPKGSPNKPKAVEEVYHPTDEEMQEAWRAADANAEPAAPQANGAAPPADLEAMSIGREDGAAGHMDHAARYRADAPGHRDYWVGYTEGKASRQAAIAAAADAN